MNPASLSIIYTANISGDEQCCLKVVSSLFVTLQLYHRKILKLVEVQQVQ